VGNLTVGHSSPGDLGARARPGAHPSVHPFLPCVYLTVISPLEAAVGVRRKKIPRGPRLKMGCHSQEDDGKGWRPIYSGRKSAKKEHSSPGHALESKKMQRGLTLLLLRAAKTSFGLPHSHSCKGRKRIVVDFLANFDETTFHKREGILHRTNSK